jgi:hypothetical protein
MRHSTAAMIQYEERPNRFPILLLKKCEKILSYLCCCKCPVDFSSDFSYASLMTKIDVEKTNI